MKRTTQIATICLAGVFLASSATFSSAQEGQEGQEGPPPNQPVPSQKEEPSMEEGEGGGYEIVSPSSVDTSKVEMEESNTQVGEAGNTEGQEVRTESVKKTEEGESIVAFNFIYYIIQKFKFSDVKSQ